MNFKVALVGLLASVSSASAFTPPKAFVVDNSKNRVVGGKPAISETDPTQHAALWIPPMKMVAGGAERAYGDDYYDGKSSALFAT